MLISAKELYHALHAVYGQSRWWSDDAYTVMFQAVLVQNTAWGNVLKTCAALGDLLTPEFVAGLPTEELESLIRSCGFYRAKARTIQALTAWFKQYNFDRQAAARVPTETLRGELLAIRGVGEETADVILVYAFYRPAFVIDAYTRRLLKRLGHAFPKDAAIRNFFETGLPEDARVYGQYHWLILEHCIAVCRKTPRCDACPLRSACARRL